MADDDDDDEVGGGDAIAASIVAIFAQFGVELGSIIGN